MKLKKQLIGMSLFAACSITQAATVDISITNLSYSMYFTPLLVSAHPTGTNLYALGEEASAEMQAMAEGGAIDGLVSVVDSIGGLNMANPAEGLLPPTATASIADFDTEENNRLSIVAMILPSNDGFVGLNAWPIPETPGTYTVYLNAYDAGTEANDEILNSDTGGMPGVAGMPGIPGGNGGAGASGVTSEENNTNIHIHRGNLGDTDSEGGASDVNSLVHRWLNPVAKVVVTVK